MQLSYEDSVPSELGKYLKFILDFFSFLGDEDFQNQTKCPVCNENIHSSLIAHHLYAVHEDFAETTDHEDPFLENKFFCRCPLCQDVLHMYSLRKHLRGSHKIMIEKSMKIIKDVHKLPIIDKKDERKNLFEQFFPNLKQESGIKVQCPMCTKEMSAEKFVRHYQTLHGSKCAICDINFRTHYQRIKHMASVHNITRGFSRCNEKKKECKICGQKFIRPCQVRNHVRVVHERLRSFLCDVCGGTFLRKSALKAHKRRHLNLKLYQCKLCRNKYGEVSTLKKHLKNAHGVVSEGRWNDPFIDRDSLPWLKLTENEAKEMLDLDVNDSAKIKKVGKSSKIKEDESIVSAEFLLEIF